MPYGPSHFLLTKIYAAPRITITIIPYAQFANAPAKNPVVAFGPAGMGDGGAFPTLSAGEFLFVVVGTSEIVGDGEMGFSSSIAICFTFGDGEGVGDAVGVGFFVGVGAGGK